MTHINQTIARRLAAGALLVLGGVHIQQYLVKHYASIPTTGTLFLLNFVVATITGLVPKPSRRPSADPKCAARSLSCSGSASPSPKRRSSTDSSPDSCRLHRRPWK